MVPVRVRRLFSDIMKTRPRVRQEPRFAKPSFWSVTFTHRLLGVLLPLSP